MRLAAGHGERLVDIADHDVAGVRADQAFHLAGLPHRLRELVAAQTPNSGRSVCVIKPSRSQ